MTSDLDIARWRLRSQLLVRPHADSVGGVVRSLLAVQAENPQQSAWAVESRTEACAPHDVATALADGRIVRTHVLRPTWHYVAAEDLGWLLDLTAPRVLVSIDRQLADEGISATDVDRVAAAVTGVLAGGHATRDDLHAALQGRALEQSGHALMLLLARLELDGLLCSGEPRDGVHTYALVADRITAPRRLDRDEALAELALRYFTGHGPATERDLAYWATLTLTDVRRGLDLAADGLASFEHEGRRFWHAPGDRPDEPANPRGHLLQVLDEMYRGYQDSRMVLDAAGVVPKGRETAIGMALVDSQLVAAMKRKVTGKHVTFELTAHRDLANDEIEIVATAAERYANHLGRTARVEWS